MQHAALIWLPIVVACAWPCMAMQLTAGPCAFSRGLPSLAHTCARGARRASGGAVMMGVTQTKMCECRAAQQRILSAPPFSRGSVEARATTRVARAPRGAGRKCLHRSPRFRPPCSRGARVAGERGQVDHACIELQHWRNPRASGLPTNAKIHKHTMH